ncbi:MAG: hypothetical protein LBT30_05440 [Clostridiales bacterium]|jgi:hypothetical protein|nr:hypothetical protein [Clostridiales bacterium]
MAKRKFLKKNELFIKAFKNIDVLDSGKKKNVNFYITNSRVVVRSQNDKKSVFFGEVKLDDIERVKQKITTKLRFVYIAISLLFAFYVYLAYFKAELGAVLYLFFPAIFFFAFRGLFLRVKNIALLFILALALICLNVLLAQINGRAEYWVLIIDSAAAIFYMAAGLTPDRFARLAIFVTVSNFITYGDLNDMVRSGLINDNNDDYVDKLLAGITDSDVRRSKKEKRRFGDKNALNGLKDRINGQAYTNVEIDGYNPGGDVNGAPASLNRAVIRSRIDFYYIYNKKSTGLYSSLRHVVERNNIKKANAKNANSYFMQRMHEHSVFDQAVKNIRTVENLHDRMDGYTAPPPKKESRRARKKRERQKALAKKLPPPTFPPPPDKRQQASYRRS